MSNYFDSARNVFLVLLLFVAGGIFQATAQTNFIDLIEEPESRVVEALAKISEGQLQSAREILENLLEDQPNFPLANLVYADLMMAASGPLAGFGGGVVIENSVDALLEEAKRRYAHQIEKQTLDHTMVPDVLLKVSSSQQRIIVVDSALSRAHVYENGIEGLRLIDDYFATAGENGLIKTVEGDKRTPMGVYFITSRLNPDGLEDLYGDGALPLNYPNEWDQRLGRTGYGIWLHGVPSNTYNRAPYATQGCIALPNADISALYETPNIQDTPVLILPSTNWVRPDQITSLRDELLVQIEKWRSSILNRSFDNYVKSYSKAFSNGVLDFDTLSQRNGAIESTIAIALTDISLFKYPGNENLVVSTFNQYHWNGTEESNNRVRQYWQLESDDQWRIVYEGDAAYQPVHFRGIPKGALPAIAKNVSTPGGYQTANRQPENAQTSSALNAIN